MDEELKVLTGHNGNGPIIVSIGVPTGAPATNAETTNTIQISPAETLNCFWVIMIFAFLDIATSSAIIYRSKLINANDMLNDEMKRDLQSLALKQFLSLQLVVFINIAHYISVSSSREKVKLCHYGYWISSILVQGWVCSVIVRQIIAMLS